MIEHTVIRKKLSNEISLVMIPMPQVAAVTTIVLMGVGSRYESDHQQGLAHFTEHMVFKGGKKFTSAQQVSQALDAVGGEFNAFTSKEYTGFYTKTAGEHMEIGLDVLSDMVLHAMIPEEELEKEKGVIVEEINMYEDMPMRKVDQVLDLLVFGKDSGLGRAITGTKKSVKAFTRQDFLDYREEFYLGSKCTIVIAGGIDPESTTPLIEKYFKELPAGEPYEAAVNQVIEGGSQILLEEKKSEQTHLMLAVPALPIGHPDRYTIRLLSTILGGNMSSRLFVSVREEQGLCYYVRAGLDAYLDNGLLIISAGVDNARLEYALVAILKELEKIVKENIPEEELARAKEFLVGKTLLGMEDSEQVAEYYGMLDLMGQEIETLPEAEKKLRSVTSDQIQKLAKELITQENLRLALIGPHNDLDKLQSIFKLDLN